MDTDGEGDVTVWIGQLKGGDGTAVELVWQRYFEKLVRLAKQKLGLSNRSGSDEEDVALSAFHSFYERATTGKLAQLDDRGDLWKVLATITIRKAYGRLKYQRAVKRGGDAPTQIFPGLSADETSWGLEQIAGKDLSPDIEVAVEETCDQMLGQLDDVQRQIALLKMEGYTNEEIAEQLNCSVRRITRKLTLIRNQWSQEESQ